MSKSIYIRTKKRKRWKWNKNLKIPREFRICERQNCSNKFEVTINSTKRYCSYNCSNKNQKHKPHSEETKRKIGKTRKGKTWEEIYGIKESKERRKACKTRKRKPGDGMDGKFHSYKTIEKMREAHKRKNLSKETLEKMSKSAKRYCQRNPKCVENRVKAMLAGLEIKPTKPERRLKNKLNHLFPREYKYVGNGNIFIGRKCPDFININGQKKIIELFGTYWHSKEVIGRTKKQEENQRIKHFAKYGYKTLIVWEKELKNIFKLKGKLKIFNKI